MKPRHLIPTLFLFLIAYPLSIGPAEWLHLKRHGYMEPAHWQEVVYMPLIEAASKSKPIEDALERYLDWWKPKGAK